MSLTVFVKINNGNHWYHITIEFSGDEFETDSEDSDSDLPETRPSPLEWLNFLNYVYNTHSRKWHKHNNYIYIYIYIYTH